MILRRFTLLLLMLAAFAGARAETVRETISEIAAQLSGELTARAYCDTIVDLNGYTAVVAVRDSTVTDARLQLFDAELKRLFDAELLEYAETALLAQSLGLQLPMANRVKVVRGTLVDLRRVGPATKCNINTRDSHLLTIEWNDDGIDNAIEVPIGYDTGRSGSRSETEDSFIALICKGDTPRKPFPAIDLETLEPYGTDTLAMLPGATYLSGEISRNIYLAGSDTILPVWSALYPLESIANLILYPADFYPAVEANLHILKHKYGESEDVTVPLDNLLAAAEKEGCTPFWGVAKWADGHLSGSIFLVNMMRGYEHLVRIECDPAAVIDGDGAIKARVSLYIPNNNVQNLYQPFVKRAPKAIELVDENE